MSFDIPYCYVSTESYVVGRFQPIPMLLSSRKILYEIRSANYDDRLLIAYSLGVDNLWKDEERARNYLVTHKPSLLVYSNFCIDKNLPGSLTVQQVGMGMPGTTEHELNIRGLRYCEEQLSNTSLYQHLKDVMLIMKYALEKQLGTDQSECAIGVRLNEVSTTKKQANSKSNTDLPIVDRWQDLLVIFVDEETVKINYKNSKSGIFNYAQFSGFKNKNTGRPNRLWKLFRIMAQVNGCFPEDTIRILRPDQILNLQKKISDLRRNLKRAFSNNGNPIVKSQGDGYLTLFGLRYETPSMEVSREAEMSRYKKYHREIDSEVDSESFIDSVTGEYVTS